MSSSKRKITMSASRRSRSIDRDNDIHPGDYRQSPAQHQPRSRPSVFSRLGTKRSPGPPSSGAAGRGALPSETLCRNIIENGTCPYGSKCKLNFKYTTYSFFHTISQNKDLASVLNF